MDNFPGCVKGAVLNRRLSGSFALVSMIATVAFCNPRTPPTSKKDRATRQHGDPSILRIVQIIKKVPAWENITNDEFGYQRRTLTIAATKAATTISRFPDALIEKAMKVFRAGAHLPLGERFTFGRLFILNRFLFNVPEYVKYNPFSLQPISYGGWAGVPGNDKYFNQLWPLGYDASGCLVIKDFFRGYGNPDYQAVEELSLIHI